MTKKYLLIIFVVIAFYFHRFETKITCRNENGKSVDWFVIIKLPQGYDFVYLTPETEDGWRRSRYSLQDDRNIVANTLQQSYVTKNNDPFYVYYNDDRPNAPSSSAGGHLKGVLNMDTSSGYWLIHSVPNFPTENQYFFASNQSLYGQSFICISISNTYLKPIVDQLLLMYSTVYSSNLPAEFTKDNELLEQLNNLIKNTRKTKLKTNMIRLKTLNSAELIHFAKSSKFEGDLYAQFMAPSLNRSLFTETWSKGRGNKLDSECQYKYKVNNVIEISLESKLFKSTSDHSKWAISQSKDTPFTCVGDINRMESQFKRGGGSLCILQSNVWESFFDAIKSYDKC